jgi:hypothetical protein
MQSLDPRTSESKLEVRRIIHLQGLANEVPDAFTDHKRVTRSHIPAVNAQKEFRYPRRLPTLLSPLFLGRGGDLRVLRTRSRGDVRSGKDLSPLPHLRIQLKKFKLKLKMLLKWQINLKLRKSLKDSILKMETPMHRAKNIAWGDRNAPTQSFWEIMMSGWTIIRRLPPIMWN